jgi:hypothetical protein
MIINLYFRCVLYLTVVVENFFSSFILKISIKEKIIYKNQTFDQVLAQFIFYQNGEEITGG